jgi:hypothetical protein
MKNILQWAQSAFYKAVNEAGGGGWGGTGIAGSLAQPMGILNHNYCEGYPLIDGIYLFLNNAIVTADAALRWETLDGDSYTSGTSKSEAQYFSYYLNSSFKARLPIHQKNNFNYLISTYIKLQNTDTQTFQINIEKLYPCKSGLIVWKRIFTYSNFVIWNNEMNNWISFTILDTSSIIFKPYLKRNWIKIYFNSSENIINEDIDISLSSRTQYIYPHTWIINKLIEIIDDWKLTEKWDILGMDIDIELNLTSINFTNIYFCFNQWLESPFVYTDILGLKPIIFSVW